MSGIEPFPHPVREDRPVSKFPFIMAAIALGAVIALQPGFNADVARRIGSPVGAAFLSILVSFTLSLAYLLVSRETVSWTTVATMPWPLWFGGVIGFGFVVGGLWLAPALGASVLFASIVAGQMIMAVAADHFGLAGYQAQSFDPWRLAGIGLVVGGVLVFQRAG
jgi:transporter family-2 protein